MGGMSVLENMAIAGNHIKDIDFIIGNSQAISEQLGTNDTFGLGMKMSKLSSWNQAMYPLEYLQKMLTQLRGIQDSVQAEGMKEEERIDWNGVKMHLFRIFQQEQFILKVQGERSEGEALEYYVSTRSSKAPLKRFLFTLDSGMITPVMKGKDIIEKAHCVMYLMTGSKIQGFIHLKEYTELAEVAVLLGINIRETNFEACEVRGKTEDIVKGTVQVRLGVDENCQVKWGPCAAWEDACKAVENDLNNIFGTSYTRARNVLHKQGPNGADTAGWMYIEQSFAISAHDTLIEAEKEFSSISQTKKADSTRELIE